MNFYNVEDIINDIDRNIDLAKTRKTAWEAVHFVTKKDGKPFANMSRNIEGAKYEVDSCALQGEHKLTVYAQSEKSGYIDDEIYCYIYIDELKDEEMLSKKQNYFPKQSLLRQIYSYDDLEDIEKAVVERIANLDKLICVLEEQKYCCFDAYKQFQSSYENAIKQLRINSKAAEDSQMFYAIKDTIEKQYYRFR